jgi:adenylate cyclase
MRMQERLLSWLYDRLGRRYPRTYLAFELLSAFPVIAGTFALFSFYYEGSFGDFMLLAGVASGLSALSIALALRRTLPLLRPIEIWIAGQRDEKSTAEAWAAAISFPWRMVRTVGALPIVLVVIPTSVFWVVALHLSPLGVLPFAAGSLIAIGYAAMLHYLALEIGLRPVLIEINEHVSARLDTGVRSLSLRWRLLLALPFINLITGLTVAALTSGGDAASDLGVDVAVALGVATTIALELTVLLTRSIMRPIADLQKATEAVAAGDFDVTVPITTADELGDLAASFNQMAQGLAERSRLRDAFGTYLDRDVADHILSEGFSEEGDEVEVSILFCDVRDFTHFAAGAGAKQVVAALNALFEVVVPIIAENGGHVDKFEGDGLLAVFGAPQPHRDHADRATRVACEISRRVNEEGGAGELRVGVGVNSGRVVAGSVGGGGRLNFSVIGDAVNVASRIEAATRDLDEDVLISGETRRRLGAGFESRSVGRHILKGIDEAVELFAPGYRSNSLADPGLGTRPNRARV